MTVRSGVLGLAVVVAIATAACVGSSEPASEREPGAPGATEPGDVSMTGVTVAEPVVASTLPLITATTAPVATDAPTPTGDPADAQPGMFADDRTTELTVSILVSQSGLGNGQTRPISFGVGLANRELEFEGSPFEYRAEGSLTAPVTYNDDGDLTENPDVLREGIDRMLDQQFVDLFVGAVPSALVKETTELAAERGIPIAIVNYEDDGTIDRAGVRLDLAGSADLSLAALAGVVVTGEHDGIVIVGDPDEESTETMQQLLLDAGAAPELVAASADTPSPSALADAREQIGSAGDRPAVVLLAPTWSGPVVDAMVPTRSDPVFFATDATLSRSEIGSLGGFGDDQITIVRRVDDLRRPEQAVFTERLFDGRPGAGSTAYAAESYDAYALVAIAAASLGSADVALLRPGMIEASRGGEPCNELAACLALAAAGADVDYDGVSGPIDLDDDGLATAAWFSIDVVDPATRGDASTTFVLQRS